MGAITFDKEFSRLTECYVNNEIDYKHLKMAYENKWTVEILKEWIEFEKLSFFGKIKYMLGV